MRISACVRRSTSTRCWKTPEPHGARRDTARAGRTCLAVVPRLERARPRARRRVDRRARGRRAAARPLDDDVHGRGRRIPRAILPAVPARRRVRQAHGRQRVRHGHRAFHDREARPAPRDIGRRAGGRSRHLRRGEPVRRVLRPRTDGTSAVSHGGHSESPDARGHRTGHVDIHDVRAAWNAGDPERHPHALLRHHTVRRTGPGHHCRADHARLRAMVACAGGSVGAPQGRGIWRSRCRQHSRGRPRRARTRDHVRDLRPRGNPPRPPR